MESMQNLKQKCYFVRNMTSLVNNGQNMLHIEFGRKQHCQILMASIGIGVYKHIFIWQANLVRLRHLTHEIKMWCVQQGFPS